MFHAATTPVPAAFCALPGLATGLVAGDVARPAAVAMSSPPPLGVNAWQAADLIQFVNGGDEAPLRIDGVEHRSGEL